MRSRVAHAASLSRAPRAPALAVAAASALLAAGCGGGTRQDAGEPAGTFAMQVVRASFPAVQSIARQTRFELRGAQHGHPHRAERGRDVDSFDYTSHYPELAADKRPVWVIERGPGAIAEPPVESQEVSPPGGGQTAYVNTWALGALAPGKTRTFTWRVVPVKAGTYTVHYTVAAGLAGKAKAQPGLGRSCAGTVHSRHRPGPRAHARQPEHRPGAKPAHPSAPASP